MGILSAITSLTGFTFGSDALLDDVLKKGAILPPVEQWTGVQKLLFKDVIPKLADEVYGYLKNDPRKLQRLIRNRIEGCECPIETCPYRFKLGYKPVVICPKEIENRNDPTFVCFMRCHMYDKWEETAAYLEHREVRGVE
jgi:hypothetical protein